MDTLDPHFAGEGVGFGSREEWQFCQVGLTKIFSIIGHDENGVDVVAVAAVVVGGDGVREAGLSQKFRLN